MSPIRVILIDDEKPCTEMLSIQLNALEQQVEILGKFNDPVEGLAFIRRAEFDLLFLDIEMPGMTGFALLERLEDIPFDVVFTTAYSQYAIEAFKWSALNYLLKPIDDEELSACIAQCCEKRKQTLDKRLVAHLYTLLEHKPALQQRIALPVTDGFEFFDLPEVIHCQADNYYTHFYMTGGKKLLVCRTLKEVEQLLKPVGFLRVHQSHLVNPAHIRRYSRQDGGNIVLSDDTVVQVSKSYRAALKAHLEQIQKL